MCKHVGIGQGVVALQTGHGFALVIANGVLHKKAAHENAWLGGNGQESAVLNHWNCFSNDGARDNLHVFALLPDSLGGPHSYWYYGRVDEVRLGITQQ